MFRICFLPLLLLMSFNLFARQTADFVGSASCTSCHQQETDLWRGSHHDLAMAEATAESVLGDFNDATFSIAGVSSRFFKRDGRFFVHTDGPDGKLHDYPIRYTFGWYPLQQYLIEFPGGRLQSLGLAWDSRTLEQGGQRWFHLYPDNPPKPGDPLHWTGRDQTWNYQCAECHSTNLKKNYDPGKDSYHTTWNEIDVACEACHGPGSVHVTWAEAAEQDPAKQASGDKGLVVDLADRDAAAWIIDEKTGKPRRSKPRTGHTQIELCARCHSRRGQIWEEYRYGDPLYQTHRLALLDGSLYYPDGQIEDEVYVYGSFIQSAMYRAGVTCSDCHEPHNLKLRAEGNEVCARCHLPSRYDNTEHHHHQPDSTGAVCANCHMPQRTYMVVDDRADHSLRVPRPDLSLELGTPNACNQCHADKPVQWTVDAVTAWYGKSEKPLAHFGQALFAARNGAPDAAARLLALAADANEPAIARATAVRALAAMPRADQLFTLRRLLQDDEALVRAAAVYYLGQLDLRSRVDLGWTSLDDPARIVRLEAARVLAPLSRQGLPERYRDQLEKALAEYRLSQRVTAERPESHLNLGLLAQTLGDAAGAETAYRTALRLDPAFAPGYANLADLYRALKQDDKGEQVLREGLQRLPEDATLHHALGLLWVREKRLSEAVTELARAAELAPENPRYAYVQALALQGQGETKQALEVLEQARQRHVNDRDLLLALVTLNRDAGDREAALGYARKLSALYPEDPQTIALLGELSGEDAADAVSSGAR
jgi:tetratricopeptide (TPR) repeat protein